MEETEKQQTLKFVSAHEPIPVGTWIGIIRDSIKTDTGHFSRGSYFILSRPIENDDDGCWFRAGVSETFVPDGSYAIMWDWGK
jgi:hypothetical protein